MRKLSFYWLGLIVLAASGCVPSPRGPEFQEIAAYAPYWYIDDETDSVIEVKNNLQSELSLLPILTLSTGKSINLAPITVAPTATKRLSLRSQPELRLYGKTGAGIWGDGMRSNSLLGNARLLLLSPKGSNARAFSAWILTHAPTNRLGTVTTFQNPADAINNIWEGLWWLPYPDTQAYYALQNTSAMPVEVAMELFSDGRVIRKKTMHFGPSAFKLINLREEIRPDNLPQLGGIRFTYKSEKGEILPGQIIGRGRLLQEKLGFSTPLKLHESLGNVSSDAVAVLNAPAAIFGKLSSLTGRSQAYIHPQLLLRSITSRDIAVEIAISGKDTTGKPIEWKLKPLVLTPDSTVHIDLEEQRSTARSNLADGLAGVHLTHDGTPTDLVAELINIDDRGGFSFYDSIRNTLYDPTSLAAISFNLAKRNQSFLIFKNTTNTPQQVSSVLDYDEGRAHYEVSLPIVPPQQVEVVDIRHLRDAHIPDRNGQILPPNVEFGGAAVFSEPGAFVVSDPTFVYTPPPEPTGDDLPDRPDFSPSCMENTSGGGGRPPPPGPQPPPPPHTYPRPPLATDQNHRCVEIQNCNLSNSHKARDYGTTPRRGIGEDAFAMEDGIVVDAGIGNPAVPGDRSRRCSSVIIRTGSMLTVYCHVRATQDILNRLAQGQQPRVSGGDRIGTTDQTGFFNGPPQSHVHIYRLRSLGGQQDSFDGIRQREDDAFCNFNVEGCGAPRSGL